MAPTILNSELCIVRVLSRKSYLGADTDRPSGFGM